MDLSRPTKIVILGIEFKIKYLPSTKMAGLNGEAIMDTRIIKILDSLSKPMLSSVLLHEIIHVILYHSGNSAIFDEVHAGLDEAVTLALETGLSQLVDLKCQKTP